MKLLKILCSISFLLMASGAFAQVEDAGVVRKRSDKDKEDVKRSAGITPRMSSFFQTSKAHEADIDYMKQIYRRLDLEKGPNAALYYPEDVIDGQENLCRIILTNVINGSVPAYEYLDGREIFTDQYKVNVPDMLQRFDIYAHEAKGSTEKNPKFEIDEADVPVNNVMNYYIIERWEFDRRSNAMKTVVEAICPVLSRSGDFDSDTRYPMFWVKFNDIRPLLAQQYVFVSDDNNVPKYSLDDYFNLGLYDGEIYKTRNMRNLSLAQMFPDEDDMKRAQDSIDNHLRNYGKDLWVPSRQEYLAAKEKQEQAKKDSDGKTVASEDELPVRQEAATTTDSSTDEETLSVAPNASSARAKKKTTTKKTKQPKASNPSGSNAAAEKSVRRRKK